MKKFLVSVLALCVIMGALVACDNTSGSGGTQAPTSAPTEPATQAPTEPATQAPTEPATQAPTEPATQAPTEPATQAPTEPATQAPTEPATQAPTEPATQVPTEPATQAPTEPVTEAPTEPVTEAPTEPAEPTDIYLNITSITMTEGDVITVEASIYPENTAYGTISWRSSDDSIVSVYMLSVGYSARIVANSPGTAQITVLLSNGTARSITVTVEQAELPSTPPGDTGSTDDFVIYSVENMFAKKYFFADRTTGDYMNDAIYERQNTIETSLGVDLVYKAAEGAGETPAFQQYSTEIMNSIKSGDAKYQLVLSHAYYAIPDLIMGGYLKDFNDFENIDLTASYWNKSIMDEVAYKDSYYLGYSDFNLAQTYVIAFNKSLYDEVKFEGNTLYDYVRGGKWTLTKMSEAAALVYKDNGDVEQNVYGLTGELWTPFVGFIQSSGESLVTRSVSGKYQISWIDDKTIKSNINNVINTIRDIDGMEETYFWRHEAFQPSRKTVELTTGRAFMQLISTNELPNLKNSTVIYGVLPYPMYEESQYKTVGYRSLNWGGYLCVPSNNIDNADTVGSVLEGLALYSEDVTKAYYDKLLGFKTSDSSDDAEMLDIIWDSICVDFGVTYEMIDDKGNLDAIVYTVPRCVMENMQFNSWHSRYGGAANNAINNKLNK